MTICRQIEGLLWCPALTSARPRSVVLHHCVQLVKLMGGSTVQGMHANLVFPCMHACIFLPRVYQTLRGSRPRGTSVSFFSGTLAQCHSRHPPTPFFVSSFAPVPYSSASFSSHQYTLTQPTSRRRELGCATLQPTPEPSTSISVRDFRIFFFLKFQSVYFFIFFNLQVFIKE